MAGPLLAPLLSGSVASAFRLLGAARCDQRNWPIPPTSSLLDAEMAGVDILPGADQSRCAHATSYL
eukprot:scaffold15362_cov72-Phaeocystis_antarctica.AAC.5